MALTNARLARVAYSLSAAGVCGASVVVSVALSAPNDFAPPQGRLTVLLTNLTSNVPLHVEGRVAFTDIEETSTVVALPVAFVSTTQAYGGSAHELKTLVLLLSGQDAAIPFTGVAGSAFHVAIMTASNPASATVVSGHVTVWRM